MNFQRSTDYALIREVMTHPRIFPWMGDDFSPSADDWRPVEDARMWYVLAWDAGELLGLFVLLPVSTICFEIHCALLPASWGDRAEAAAAGVLRWIGSVSPCRRVVASIPAYNRLACRLAARAGMTEWGVNKESFMKFGELQDVIHFGYSGVPSCRV